MKFQGSRPIYLQIAESVENGILRGEFGPEERAPAVRDLALSLEVNPNTVVRAFLELEQAGVILKRRGLGSYVSADAPARILERRRRVFLQDELPALVGTMILLGITPADVSAHYDSHKASKDRK